MPQLRAAWCQLAEQTVADFTATSIGDLVDVLSDLAASLDASQDPGARRPPLTNQHLRFLAT